MFLESLKNNFLSYGKLACLYVIGQPVATISAMKMEMTVAAPMDGVVKAVHVVKGQKMAGDDLLMDIE